MDLKTGHLKLLLEEQKVKRRKKSEQSLRDLWLIIWHYGNLRRRRKNGAERIFEETTAENFSNLNKERETQF